MNHTAIAGDRLSAPHVLSYDYTRSTGPVIGAFLTGLRERCIYGVRGSDGRVLVPPQEYDPLTSQELDELVEVDDEGEVVTWSWQSEPRDHHPLDHPFAWALVRLDGADTPLLHAVDAGEATVMSTGMRVRARWADERTGRIQDLACFEPVSGGG